jgi:hypothetical protein
MCNIIDAIVSIFKNRQDLRNDSHLNFPELGDKKRHLLQGEKKTEMLVRMRTAKERLLEMADGLTDKSERYLAENVSSLLSEVLQKSCIGDNLEYFSVMVTQENPVTGYKWHKSPSDLSQQLSVSHTFMFVDFYIHVFFIAAGDECVFEKTGNHGFTNWIFYDRYARREGSLVTLN